MNFTFKVMFLKKNALDAIYLSSQFELYMYPD